MTQQRKTSSRFIEFLEMLEERRGRGALAALRRGLGAAPGSVPEMHPYIAQWVSEESTRWEEDVHYLVAALFAYHPQSWHRSDESWSHQPGRFLSLASQREKPTTTGTAWEHRFMILADRPPHEDLHLHLRHAISLLKAQGTAG